MTYAIVFISAGLLVYWIQQTAGIIRAERRGRRAAQLKARMEA